MFPCVLKKLSFLGDGNTYPAHFDKKLIFKGGCAALFVTDEDRNYFGGNHDIAAVICAQKDKST